MQHYRTIFLLMAFVVLLSGCAAQRQTAMTSSEHHVSPIFNVADTNSFFSALRFGMTRDDFDRLVREHQSNGLLINEVAMPASDYRHPLNPLSSSGILCSFDDTRHLRLPGSGIYAFFFLRRYERGSWRLGESTLGSWRRWSATEEGCLSHTNGGWSVFVCPVNQIR